MIGRGGRDRIRRDFSPRFEDKGGNHGRNTNAPPSRCLWVGNLSHHVTEKTLSEHFLRFGELESLSFQPGRSYTFVTFRKEEDAILAIRGLEGFVVSGMPLRIEFAKAERPLTSARDEDHQQHRDERRAADHGMPFFQGGSRTHHTSPEQSYPDKSRMGDKNVEPSEVLWIGFPAFLNVDEITLRRAFMPFGEIEKISVFPGRSYAFVRFRSVVAACRAKEALQGKLFNNPRVSICFAKSDTGPSERGRNFLTSLSPHFKSNSHPGQQPTEGFRRLDRNFESSTGETHMGSPRFMSNLESGDSGITGLGRNSSLWTGGGSPFEPMRLQAPGSQLGRSEDIYERNRSSPARDRRSRGVRHRDFSPDSFPVKSPLYENPWNLTDDAFLFREAKKLKTRSFPPEKELPEYPFSDLEQDKPHVGLPRTFPYLPEREAHDKNFESGPLGYKRIPDHAMNLIRAHGEGDDHARSSYDRFDAGFGSLINAVKWPTPELRQSPLNEEWKWEGTIAKGGTPVCRARCFPVGKVLDIMLPEFLNCTARTGLDMLAKHFYQAASVWVVFFVPESDADIAFYNEFMHYLGEKRRAAVAKLGEKTTLFLVPPSDFSEKTLKVPGKMSLSGVILRFQYPNPLETIDSKLPLLHEDISYPKLETPDVRSSARGQSQSYVNSSSEPIPLGSTISASRKAAVENFPFLRSMYGPASSASLPESLNENRYDQPLQRHNHVFPSNWSHDPRTPISGTENIPSQISSNATVRPDDSITQEYHSMNPRVMQEASLGHFTPGISGIPVSGASKFTQQEIKSQASTSMSLPSLQPEQLAQLASLFGQKQESGNVPAFSLGDDSKQSFLMNQADPVRSSQSSTLRNLASSSNPSSLQISQGQLLQPSSNVPAVRPTSTEQQIGGTENHGNQSLHSSGAVEEERDADPQKRLQATLQLAAALLQQIQQQAKTVDQQ